MLIFYHILLFHICKKMRMGGRENQGRVTDPSLRLQ